MRPFYALLLSLLTLPLLAQTFVSVEEQETFTAQEVRGSLFGLVPAEYDIITYKITYNTIDVFGEPTVASGLLCLPATDNVAYPFALYNHGTVTDREAVPSRVGVQERTIAYAFATNGFIVVAPDYLGLGDNQGIHPYVHAESEASAGRDLLLAARQWLDTEGVPYTDQLFLTGYSQGGHATQALHRDLQENPGADSLEVTAATHLSGPYSISDVMRNILFQEGLGTFPGYVLYTYISYDYVYDLFDSYDELFLPAYVPLMDSLTAGTITPGAFNGRIQSILDEGNLVMADLFQDSVRTQLATKDTTAGIVRALIDNDTYDWAPEAPTRIVYCTADEQVPFQNAIVADSVMAENGSAAVTLVDGGMLSHGGCLLPALSQTLELFTALAAPVSSVNVANDFDLRLSPNPARPGGVLQLGDIPVGSYDYSLYEGTGRLVASGSLRSDAGLRMPTHLSAGLHFLRLRDRDGGVAVRRIIVQRD